MKRNIFCAVLCLISLASYAQQKITGNISDAQGQAVAYANVLLLNAPDSSLVRGTVTDEKGDYELINSQEGNYLIAASMLGFQTVYGESLILEGNSPLDLPTLVLRENSAMLEEVTVTAQKPLFEQQIDRTVINVQNSITSAGGTVLEILEKSPGIEVDRGNNILSMFGKQGLVVMINGKRSRMDGAAILQLLSNMPSNNIQKIELVTTPPASFDAEGDAGIINIVLIKNTEEGVNGSYSLNLGHGIRPKMGGAANLNWRKGKVNLYGDLSVAHNYLRQDNEYTRRVSLEGLITSTVGVSNRPATQGLYSSRLGLDYQLSEKTTVGLLLSGYVSTWYLDARTQVDVINPTNGLTRSHLRSDETNNWKHGMANLSLQHEFKEGEILSFDLDYLYYFDHNPTDYLNEIFNEAGNLIEEENFQSRKETPISFWVGKVDYRKKIGENFQWETGLKGTYSTFVNDISVASLEGENLIFDPQYTARYELLEKIGAAYTSFQYQIDPQTKLQAGLRYEYTNFDLSTATEPKLVNRSYGRLFPSFYLSRDLNEDHRLQLSFSQRITRPTLNIIAPALFFWGPNTLLAGNPAVQPTITSNAKLDYRYKTYLFSLQYSYDEAPISWGQPIIIPEKNQLINRAQNMKSRQTILGTINFPLTFTPWWASRYNLNMYWQQQQPIFAGEIIRRQDWYYEANTTQSFTLPRDFSIELQGRYISDLAYGLSNIPGRGSIDFGVQKEWNKGNHQLSLNWSDVFNTANEVRLIYDVPELTLDYTWLYRWESSLVRLTYRHNFGQKGVKSARQRQTGSEEERSRVD